MHGCSPELQIRNVRREWKSHKPEWKSHKTSQFGATLYIVISSLWTSRNGRHFADDIFKLVFCYEAVWISLIVVPLGLIYNTSSFVQPWTVHYDDVIMSTIASRTTSLTTVYLIVYSRADQRKHQNSASLAFLRGIHRRPVNSPHKGPVTRKMVPFNDVIMVPNYYPKQWRLAYTYICATRPLVNHAPRALLCNCMMTTARFGLVNCLT